VRHDELLDQKQEIEPSTASKACRYFSLQRKRSAADLRGIQLDPSRALGAGPRPQDPCDKKGEHGVLCFSRDFIFSSPAYLLEKIFDPTGAGDSFAGGFIGYLCQVPKANPAALRRAVVYGSIIASYNVESFSLRRLASLKRSQIERRCRLYRDMTEF